jgi:plastocyanin
MRITMIPAAAAAAGLFVLAAGLGAASATPGGVQVAIKDFDFRPMDVTVPVGGSVTWKNLDAEPHTVTSTGGAFRSEALDQGESYTQKFTRAGVYKYICTIHPNMRATVTVR